MYIACRQINRLKETLSITSMPIAFSWDGHIISGSEHVYGIPEHADSLVMRVIIKNDLPCMLLCAWKPAFLKSSHK